MCWRDHVWAPAGSLHHSSLWVKFLPFWGWSKCVSPHPTLIQEEHFKSVVCAMCFQAVASALVVRPRICSIFSFPEDPGPGGTWWHELLTFWWRVCKAALVAMKTLKTQTIKRILKKKNHEGNEDPYWFNLPLALVSTELLAPDAEFPQPINRKAQCLSLRYCPEDFDLSERANTPGNEGRTKLFVQDKC